METISERIFNNKLDGVPLEIVLEIGKEIDRMMKEEGKTIDAAVFIATGRLVKKYAGDVPASDNMGKWFETCIKIGQEVYSMCMKRYPAAKVDVLYKQSVAAAYRGTIDTMIEKLASIKAKNYAITED